MTEKEEDTYSGLDLEDQQSQARTGGTTGEDDAETVEEFLRFLFAAEPDVAEGVIYRARMRMCGLPEYVRRGIKVLIQNGYL